MDGSGVIYDPNGLNREELLRLANSRMMISNFDMSKLGPGGFRVLVDEPSATLPGTRALAARAGPPRSGAVHRIANPPAPPRRRRRRTIA